MSTFSELNLREEAEPQYVTVTRPRGIDVNLAGKFAIACKPCPTQAVNLTQKERFHEAARLSQNVDEELGGTAQGHISYASVDLLQTEPFMSIFIRRGEEEKTPYLGSCRDGEVDGRSGGKAGQTGAKEVQRGVRRCGTAEICDGSLRDSWESAHAERSTLQIAHSELRR